MRHSLKRASVAVLAGMFALLSLPAPVLRAASDSEQQAVNNAHRFLKTGDIGRFTLGFVHFGADYHGHEYVESLPVFDRSGNRVEGNFKLVYRFHWEDDGVTDVAFVCDANGNVYGVQIVRTNAVLNQPFVLADAAIQVLGNLVIEANKDKMSPNERKLIQSFVDNADAHGMLEWSLRFQQLVAK